VNRGRLAAIAGVSLLVIFGWYFGVLAPKSKQLKDERAKVDASRATEQSLNATLKRLQDLARQRPARQAELQRLAAAVPAQPDLAGFIIAADKMAIDSGVDWVSVSPSPPSAGAVGAPSTIAMSIQVQGGFFQVLDYLNRMEHLERVVVVDTVQLTASTGNGPSPTLSVSMNARMFTTAAPTRASGPAGAGGAGATTTSTAPGATATTVTTTASPTTAPGG